MCMNGAGVSNFSSAIGPTTSGFALGGKNLPTISQSPGALFGQLGGGFRGDLSSFKTQFGIASAVKGLVGAFAGLKAASAQKDSLLYQAQVQQRNADIIEMQKKDERATSKRERDAIRRKITAIQKGIAPEAAGRNLLLGGGAPLEILMSSEVIKRADIGQAKVNEEKRIFGLNIKKYNAQTQGAILSRTASNITPRSDFASSLMSSASDSYLKYKTFKNSSIKGNQLVNALKGF